MAVQKKMEKQKLRSYVKILYARWKLPFGLETPCFHTFIEIKQKNKVIDFGFINVFPVWFLSLVFPAPGKIYRGIKKNYDMVYSKTISTDPKIARNLLKIITSREGRWKVYHAFFHNCFQWRNSILEEAGIKRHPEWDWFWRR